jgi:hypothetical protein
MTEHSLEADYVIVGAGAVAMAFADTLLTDTEASIIMLDRRHKPGGHWNDSYPFVRLHGPSINYGVNSRPLGTGRVDQVGLNKGLHELPVAMKYALILIKSCGSGFCLAGALHTFRCATMTMAASSLRSLQANARR